MKHFKYLSIVASGLLLATSCTDTFEETMIQNVEKPNTIAELEYLNAYPTLKEALHGGSSRGVNPSFTLGTGVTVSEYLNHGGVYALSNTNFDMLTAGNAMKYSSVVKDNGDMDFGTVQSFVNDAYNAGMQIYGHTLCWHSQQNLKWLNSLIADKVIELGGGDAPKFMASVIGEADGSSTCDNLISRVKGNEDVPSPIVSDPERGNVYKCDILADPENAWDCQFFIKSKKALKAGDNIHVSFWYKTADSRKIETQAHGEPGNYHHWACIGTLESSEEWKEFNFDGSVGGEWVGDDGFIAIAFNLSSNAASSCFYVDDVVFEVEENAPATYDAPLISGGDAADGECANLISRVKGNGDVPSPVVQDAERGAVYKCDILADPVEAWDCQFFIKSNEALNAGDKIKMHFWYRADDQRKIETQAHGEPGDYHHWSCIGTLEASKEWKEFNYEGAVGGEWVGNNGFISVAFNLSSAPAASCFYIDDVTFTIEKSGNTMNIPLTDEEKYAAIDGELSRWIKGMMDATGGKVKAWDVVNEPISDNNNANLKHFAVEANAESFYWQDYLGDDYVRNAVKYAREHYAAQEGANPSDLKLFVNDYGLEGNGSKKVTSLISWINRWESDGETKIDGIGTQMHVTYSTDPEAQARNEQGVIDMFTKLAATGKLIRITELDMGIKTSDHWSESGRKTETVTLEESKKMGEYYRFIINKYFEIIPVEQQFGICQWSQTDSPENSHWKEGEPIGLWNLDYQRKPTYGGFVEGILDIAK